MEIGVEDAIADTIEAMSNMETNVCHEISVNGIEATPCPVPNCIYHTNTVIRCDNISGTVMSKTL